MAHVETHRVGILKIDGQHEQLLALLRSANRILRMEEAVVGAHQTVLKGLMGAFSEHFRFEESLMEVYAYAEAAAHKRSAEHSPTARGGHRAPCKWCYPQLVETVARSRETSPRGIPWFCEAEIRKGLRSSRSNGAAMHWLSSYEIGAEDLNEQHRALLTQLERAPRMLASGESTAAQQLLRITQLLRAFRAHFEHEEMLMNQYRYADYSFHKRLHDQFLDLLENVIVQHRSGANRDAEVELLEYAGHWFIAHIDRTDRPLGSFLARVRSGATRSL